MPRKLKIVLSNNPGMAVKRPGSSSIILNRNGYTPKNGDEKKFTDLHKVQKWEDRVGNGDDVYGGPKMKSVKYYQRASNKFGYDPDADQDAEFVADKSRTVQHVATEEDDLNEISQEKADDYEGKAVKSLNRNMRWGKALTRVGLGRFAGKAARKVNNRATGIERAGDRGPKYTTQTTYHPNPTGGWPIQKHEVVRKRGSYYDQAKFQGPTLQQKAEKVASDKKAATAAKRAKTLADKKAAKVAAAPVKAEVKRSPRVKKEKPPRTPEQIGRIDFKSTSAKRREVKEAFDFLVEFGKNSGTPIAFKATGRPKAANDSAGRSYSGSIKKSYVSSNGNTSEQGFKSRATTANDNTQVIPFKKKITEDSDRSNIPDSANSSKKPKRFPKKSVTDNTESIRQGDYSLSSGGSLNGGLHEMILEYSNVADAKEGAQHIADYHMEPCFLHQFKNRKGDDAYHVIRKSHYDNDMSRFYGYNLRHVIVPTPPKPIKWNKSSKSIAAATATRVEQEVFDEAPKKSRLQQYYEKKYKDAGGASAKGSPYQPNLSAITDMVEDIHDKQKGTIINTFPKETASTNAAMSAELQKPGKRLRICTRFSKQMRPGNIGSLAAPGNPGKSTHGYAEETIQERRRFLGKKTYTNVPKVLKGANDHPAIAAKEKMKMKKEDAEYSTDFLMSE